MIWIVKLGNDEKSDDEEERNGLVPVVALVETANEYRDDCSEYSNEEASVPSRSFHRLLYHHYSKRPHHFPRKERKSIEIDDWSRSFDTHHITIQSSSGIQNRFGTSCSFETMTLRLIVTANLILIGIVGIIRWNTMIGTLERSKNSSLVTLHRSPVMLIYFQMIIQPIYRLYPTLFKIWLIDQGLKAFRRTKITRCERSLCSFQPIE